MKKLLCAMALLCALDARADVVFNSKVLLSATEGAASVDGAITSLSTTKELELKSFVCRAEATPISGTTPTLDLKIQHCRTTAASSCVDLCTFTPCTTVACFGDGVQHHFSTGTEAIYPYFRAVSVIGGTEPVYTYSVSIDY